MSLNFAELLADLFSQAGNPAGAASPQDSRQAPEQDPAVVAARAKAGIERLASENPSDFVSTSLSLLSSDNSDMISTFVESCIKRVFNPRLWLDQGREWRGRVENALSELLANDSRTTRNNAASCIAWIGPVEYRADLSPGFVDWVDIGEDMERTEPLSVWHVGKVAVMRELVESGFITPELRQFEKIAQGVMKASIQYLNLKWNRHEWALQSELKAEVLTLLKCSMHLWTRVLKDERCCSDLMKGVHGTIRDFRAQYYQVMTSMFKYHYQSVVSLDAECLNTVLEASLEDLKPSSNHAVYAMRLWTKIAKYESIIDAKYALFLTKRKKEDEACEGSVHLVRGAFGPSLRDSVVELISFPVKDAERQDAIHDMMVAFASAEKQMMLDELGDYFKHEIGNRNLEDRYRAMFLAMCILDIADAELFMENIGQILSCAESENQEFKTFAVECLARVIAKFPKVLSLPADASTILDIAKHDSANPSVYKLLESTLKAFRPMDPFFDVLDFLKSVRIAEAFEVMSTLIILAGECYKDRETERMLQRQREFKDQTLDTMNYLLGILRELPSDDDEHLIPGICMALSSCVIALGPAIEPYVAGIVGVLLPHVGNSCDFDVISVISEMKAFFFASQSESVETIINMLFANLKTYNTELAVQAATLIGDLCFIDLLRMENYIPEIISLFSEVAGEVVKSITGPSSTSTLTDILPPLLDASADVINGMASSLMDTSQAGSLVIQAVAEISEPVRRLVMGQFSDWSNHMELYQSVIRFYAVCAKVSDDVKNLVAPVFKLIKIGSKLALPDATAASFVVSILSNLCKSERSLGVHLRDPSVKYFLSDVRLPSAELRDTAARLMAHLFPL